jgi:hypothetical protein
MSLNKPIWKLRNWIDLEKLDWSELSRNPKAIKVLEKNQDKINWSKLSKNSNAIELLEKNQDKIDWQQLSENPSIFELDYEAMKIANQMIYEELIKEVMKPSRVFKNTDYDYIEELFGN